MGKDRQHNSQYTRATVRQNSFNESDNTIEVVFVTEAPVEMENDDGQRFLEILSCDPASVRLDRAMSGAPFLKDHDSTKVENQIGVVVDVWFENRSGIAKIQLSNRPDCAGIVNDIKSGVLRNISVGYDVFKYEPIGNDERGLPMLRAVDWEVAEISTVTIPADYSAVTRKKYPSNQKSNKMSDKKREDAIKDAVQRVGLDSKIADELIASGVSVEEALTQLLDKVKEAAGVDKPDDEGAGSDTPPANEDGARAAEDDDEDDDEDKEKGERSKAVKAERTRASTITKSVRAANLDNSFAQKLIDEGTSIEKARELIINKMAENQKIPNVRMGGQDDGVITRNALQEAILHRAAPGQHKLTTEKARDFRYLSLLEVARTILEHSGVRTKQFSPSEIVTRALSTSDFPKLLANVANKFLRKSYEEQPQTWRPLATQQNAKDFKEITGIIIGGGGSLSPKLENGEYKMGRLTESAEVFKIAEFGEIIPITRKAIINDDLGGFTDLSRFLAAKAARTESDIVWGLITGNPKMADGKEVFHTAHKNLANTGAAISETTLNAATVALMNQTGLEKEVLNLLPKYLVVSPLNLMTAKKWMTSVNSTKVDDTNVFENAYEVISDPRLTGNAWYLTTTPQQLEMIKFAYLEGQEGVYTEEETDFNTDNIKIKVRLDFGAAIMDYRGFYKNPGQ